MSARPIVVSPARQVHILDGDATGGGHGPGRGVSGKSEFSSSLADTEIIQGILQIANDPTSYPSGTIPSSGRRVAIRGNIKGTPAVVIVDPAQAEVVTAWPEGVARNP